MTGSGLVRDLGRLVAAAGVITDEDIRRTAEVDWTGQFVGRAAALLRPASVGETAAVLSYCTQHHIAVVPQGGNTGLVGGSVPDQSGDAIVLSTARLNAIEPIDELSAQVTVGAGTVLATLQRATRAVGLEPAVDFAARDSATVGGMVATNAGGIHVLRHGTTRRQLAGIEAVLANGAALSHLGGLEKDNTGYDLAGLLCGSEGTLGVVSRVRLKLVRVPAYRVVALLAWPDLASAVAAVAALRDALPAMDAAEYMVRRGVEAVMATHHVADPFAEPYPVYVLVEASGRDDPTAELAGAVAGLPDVVDVAVAASPGQREALWALRELHTPALAAIGPPRKYDVTLPLPGLAAFAADIETKVHQREGLTCHHFGHLGDGNVHVNVVGDGDVSDLDAVVLETVAQRGGSISAEHGIGRLKRDWLHLSRSPAEVAAFVAIKGALDPAGILNPGVLLPSGLR